MSDTPDDYDIDDYRTENEALRQENAELRDACQALQTELDRRDHLAWRHP